MAVGPDHQLAIGCDAGSAVIISEDFSSNSTTVIAALPDENGTDGIWHNHGRQSLFLCQWRPQPSATGRRGCGRTGEEVLTVDVSHHERMGCV
jgi:hypothetical protein